MTENFTFMF